MAPKPSAGASEPGADAGERERDKPAGAATSAAEGPAAEGPATEGPAADADAGAAATRAAQQQQQQRQQLARSSDVLFLVLERQRHAAREARMAKRREIDGMVEAGEQLSMSPTWCWALRGAEDDDGEEGAVAGGGWWPSIRCFVSRHGDWAGGNHGEHEYGADGLRQHENHEPLVHALPEDVCFMATCASAARACKAWRSIAFRAADRATVSWEGVHLEWRQDWRSTAPRTRPPFDPLASLRAYEGGVLRALCVRGKPDDPLRLHSFAHALGVAKKPLAKECVDREDARVAGVLRGLKLLRLEFAKSLVDTRSHWYLCTPLPSPPLLSGLVHLDLQQWRSIYRPASASSFSFFTRSNLPSLRSLRVNVTYDSNCPFCLAGGGGHIGDGDSDDDAPFVVDPPALTRLVVGGEQFLEIVTPALWPRAEPLLVSMRSLACLSPSLLSLSASRAPMTAEGFSPDGQSQGAFGDGDPRAPVLAGTWVVNPMARLVSPLSGLTQLSHLTSLELEIDYDWEPVEEQRRWLLAARKLHLAFAPSLRRLILDECRWSGAENETLRLPPAISLLTALTCLEVRARRLYSVGSLRTLHGLRRLVVDAGIDEDEVEDDGDDDDDEDDEDGGLPHPPVLGRDLQSLTSLEHLSLSRTAPCYAPVIENGLPRLRQLLLRRFWPRSVAAAARARLESGVSVFLLHHYDWTPPLPLVAADLDRPVRCAIGERTALTGTVEAIDVEEDAESVARHAQVHQALLDAVSEDEEDEAAAIAEEEDDEADEVVAMSEEESYETASDQA